MKDEIVGHKLALKRFKDGLKGITMLNKVFIEGFHKGKQDDLNLDPYENDGSEHFDDVVDRLNDANERNWAP